MLEPAHTQGQGCSREEEQHVQGDRCFMVHMKRAWGGAAHWRPRWHTVPWEELDSHSGPSDSNSSFDPSLGVTIRAQWALTEPKKANIG